MTQYLVLERAIEGDASRELWTPVGTFSAASGDLACRAAARRDGEGHTHPGSYWAVPARSVKGNRTEVEVEQREVVSFRSPRSQHAAS